MPTRLAIRVSNLIARASPNLAALIDWLIPANHGSDLDAMNGQVVRQETIQSLITDMAPQLVIETGTFRSTTTRFLAALTVCPVISSELNPRFALFSRWKTRGIKRIEIRSSDSRSVIKDIIDDPLHPEQRVFFYLDAHWNSDLPLAEELRLIGPRFQDSAIVIDDFAVPHDDGYKYDDYGSGKALVPEYVPWAALEGWSAYVPAVPSSEESGARRGCLVLLHGRLDDPGIIERARLRRL